MTDANEQDPSGEKPEEQSAPFRFSASNPIPESPRGRLARASRQTPEGEKTEEQPAPSRYAASNLIPESPRGKVAQAGQQNPEGENTEEQPEPFGHTATNLIPEIPRGKVAQPKQQELRGEKTEERPEPLGYAIIEPPADIPRGKRALAGQKSPKGEKTEEQPEPLGYAIIEPPAESPRGKLAKAGQKSPEGEKTEEQPEPLHYAIVEPLPESPDGKVAPAGQQDLEGEKTEEQPESLHYAIVVPPPPPPGVFTHPDLPDPLNASVDAKGMTPIQAPATAPPPVAKTPVAGGRKPAPSRTWIYITAVAVLGLIFGSAIAVFFSRMSAATAPYDLGSVNSIAAGLKGHLVTKWDRKVEYRLTVEPSDPDRRVGFALAVAQPPRPLSIEIHLQDAQGFVLCSREILLKYVPGSAPAIAAPNPETQAGNADAANAAGTPPAHAEELTAAQEAEREMGKEVFKNEIGPDGRIAGLDAQGEIPCPEKVYASVSTWSFTPNFPSVAEQDAMVKGQSEAQTNGGQSSAETPAPRRRAPRIPAPPLLGFTIEGDDVIVDFDPSRGVIETRAGKTFLFSKTSGDIANPKWQDYPVSIHYICDQASACTITHSGAGALRVRMSR